MTTDFKLIYVLVLLTLTSCQVSESFYQVYKVQPDSNIISKSDNLVYENRHCVLKYNLWDEDGNIGFVIENKTDSTIYLQMDKCFYVLNGYSNDYYRNRIYTRSVGKAVAIGKTNTLSRAVLGIDAFGRSGISQAGASAELQNSTSHEYAVAINESKTVCIPPGTSKEILEYSIFDQIYRDCQLTLWPYTQSKVTLEFEEKTSPYVFENRISYSLGEDPDIYNIQNQFFVTKITNYSKSGFYAYVKLERCGEKSINRHWIERLTAPDAFYNSYSNTLSTFRR